MEQLIDELIDVAMNTGEPERRQRIKELLERIRPQTDPALLEVRDLLRFMFIDRQHTEIGMMRKIAREAHHKNRHGIKENKELREAEEDLATLQNFVGLVGVDLMTYLTPVIGKELNYIRNIRAQIDRNLAKQTASQKSSEVDSLAQPEPKMIIEP
jgi:hypothetical protein